MPLNYIFQEQYLILPIPPRSGYAMCLIFHFIYTRHYKLRGLSQNDYKLIKSIKNLLFLVLLIVLYRKFKQILFFDTSYFEFFVTVVNKLIFTFASYFTAIYFIKNKHVLDKVKYALLGSAILIIISMYFSDMLYGMGFSMRETAEQASMIDFRYAGFYYGGDVNSVGVFLNFLVGLFLFSVEDRKVNLKTIIIVIVLSVGIGLTGSRAAFISLVLILIIFSSTNSLLIFRSPKVIIGMIFLVLSFSYMGIYLDVFDKTIGRIETRGVAQELDPSSGTGTRSLRWLMFINYSFSSYYRLFLGNDSILFTNIADRFRDVHNHFLHILYYNGIIFLGLYIYYISKIQVIVIKNRTFVVGMTLILPFIIGGILVSNIKEIYLYFMLTPLLITKPSKVQTLNI